ncbi:hypothetical protein PSEUBRA_005416 [Kalmanozyma brasiliensis GHG001]|uniref:DUF2423 domain-containing protein n=1 Tax=Kalmanozyma brasiliensis (strain GHG001) TaxID=1365824 RepID=V5ET52_KALBG|nr:uncharacterized protein PSEUBRA_005416 [Kalmanozyma brasiliensis GHG001]EST05154.1 hypothetical protein PSEUBRA_005416 [Kalmanozyma brasiliensis GHG001]
MAKSLRSSSKLKARNQKRTNPKSDYAVAEAARVNALSARLTEGLKKDKVPVESTEDEEEEETMMDVAEPKVATEPTEGGEKKISTSGPRNSRREEYRTGRGLKRYKNSGGNSLFNAHKSKNNGKAKRRR